MGYAEMMKNTLRFVKWNDYRGSKNAVVIHFESSPSLELPVRDILGENGKGLQAEPNIETGTYGYGRCLDGKTRNSFVKNRKGYLLFLTRYVGTRTEYIGRDFIVGYYKITQIADARDPHIRNLENEACPEIEHCYALRSQDMKFVSVSDAFELSSEKLKEWGYKGKISRQLRLALDESKLGEILAYFADKTDASPLYIAEIEKLTQKSKNNTESESTDETDETNAANASSDSRTNENPQT